MHRAELSRVGARLPPRELELAIGGVLVDLCVAVAVGDVEVAGPGVDPDVRRSRSEGLAAHLGLGLALLAQPEDQLAVPGPFIDGVASCVDAKDRAVEPHRYPVRRDELAFAPRLDERAVLVEDDHRVLAPIPDVNIVVLVDRDGGRLFVEPPIWEVAVLSSVRS